MTNQPGCDSIYTCSLQISVFVPLEEFFAQPRAGQLVWRTIKAPGQQTTASGRVPFQEQAFCSMYILDKETAMDLASSSSLLRCT